MNHFRQLGLDILVLAFFAGCAFVGLSLASYSPSDPLSGPSSLAGEAVSNLCGPAGAVVAHGALWLLGLTAFYLLYELARFNLRLLTDRPGTDWSARVIGGSIAVLGICAGLALFVPQAVAPQFATEIPHGLGGWLGARTGGALQNYFSVTGSAILVGTFVIAGLILSGDLDLLGNMLRWAGRPIWWIWRAARYLLVGLWRSGRSWSDKRRERRHAKKASAFRTKRKSKKSEPPATIALPAAQPAPDERERPAKSDHPAPEKRQKPERAAEHPGPSLHQPTEINEETAERDPPPVLRLHTHAAEDEVDEEEEVDDSPSPPEPPLESEAPVEPEPAPEPPVEQKPEPVLEPEPAPVPEQEPASEPESEPKPTRPPVRVNQPEELPRPHKEAWLRPVKRLCAHDVPEMELLDEPEEFPYEELAERARRAAITLERTFQEFRLNVRVAEVDTGPVITQFELDLEKGLRVAKVAALADDLAIALRVPAVRVVSSIPGKNTVGVEVPNETQVMVRLRELIESSPQAIKKYRIPMFLGKDVSGRGLAVDLTKMPHLLIAGRTGTGKSVCLNTLIMSILMTRTAEEVRMLMIDPKMVELSPYKRIPHLMHPVITDMKKAEKVLSWAVDKMEERYDLLARCGVRHLDQYNKLSRAERLERMGMSELDEEADSIPDRMPYIVIIADEMADMMMTSGKDVEGHIIRLAQKSRAVGIHLVLATQKPTVDVITGLIKSNLPARISFQVASRTDSRVVLDSLGAERLLDDGDMLYLAPGTSHLTRAQGTFTSDEETDRIIDFFSDVEPQYSEELARLNATGGGGGAPGASRDRDDLYDDAVEIVVREGRGSTSLLQRALGIGYGRAARLIDYMAEDGIVGDYNGSQARDVLYTAEQWEAIRGGETVGV